MVLVIGIIMGAVAVIFALQNITPVVIKFLGWDFQASLALVIILAIAAGAVIALLFSLPSAIRSAIERGRLRRQTRKLEDDLENHKEMLDQVHKQASEQSITSAVEKQSESDDSKTI